MNAKNIAHQDSSINKTEVELPSPELLLADERSRIRREYKLSQLNVTLALVALASVIGTLILSWTITPLHGYTNLDEDNRLVEISSLRDHSEYSEIEIFNYVTRALTDCMTFTYQSMRSEILSCTGEYLSEAGRKDFDKLLIEKFIDVSKKYFFDVKTEIIHAPAKLKTDQKEIYGRAAWKVTVPASILLQFDKSTRRDNIEKKWQITVWVVREYKSVKRSGLALHSIAMMER